MNEEEKKVIETINDYIKKKEELGDLGDDFTINFRDTKPLKALINLIEKQRKEIETYKNEIKLQGYVTVDYIHKDKIRAKRKELKQIIEFEKPTYENCIKYTIDILEELLEEK